MGFRSGRNWSMTSGDIRTVRSQVPEVEFISPIMWGARSNKNVVFGDKFEIYSIVGAEPDYFEISCVNIL